MKLTMYKTLLFSIFIQVITGIIEISAMFIHAPTRYTFLKQMMMLELIVQFIEGSFYIYWFYHFNAISNITPSRYLDWSITTPTMLVNLLFYLRYLSSTEPLDFFTVLNEEWNTILIILVLNWLMLLFGYLGEISVIPALVGVSLGFLPFLIYYYLIYEKYALLTDDGFKIFLYFFIFWSLYGIVATLPYKMKNTCYNILDLFSKNIFGIFLTYLIFKNKTL
jgi:hypothetical protein